jgi:hypothetical protein
MRSEVKRRESIERGDMSTADKARRPATPSESRATLAAGKKPLPERSGDMYGPEMDSAEEGEDEQ